MRFYRSVGATKRQVDALIGGEAGVLAAVDTVIGLALGLALYLASRAWLPGVSAFPFVVPAAPVVASIAVLFVVAFALITALSVLAPCAR